MGPARGLIGYGVGLAVLLAGAELFARVFEPALAAAGDRVAFKQALFERQGPTARLILGTSRLNDGIAARDLGGFNASVPSSSLAVQAHLLDQGLKHAGLRQVVLELSPEQVEGSGALPDRANDERSVLLRHRRALAIENLPRLAALAMPGRFDGSEWFRSRWALEGLRELRGVPDAALDAPPRRVAAGPGPPDWDATAVALQQMSDRARAAKVDLVWVVPPAEPDAREAQCHGPFAALLPLVAARTERQVLDYSCAELPQAFFTDRTHLGAAGRAWLTHSLKRELAGDAL